MAEISLRALALVATGGALGCVLRYLVGAWVVRGDYPWATLVVNLVGSFAIGLAMFGALERGWLSPSAHLLLVVGVLGGFTTMSSFAYESVALVEDEKMGRAAAYVLLTVAGSLGMTLLARALARAAAAQ